MKLCSLLKLLLAKHAFKYREINPLQQFMTSKSNLLTSRISDLLTLTL